MVASTQKRGENSGQRRHSRCEANRTFATLHLRNFGLQGRCRKRTLPRVGKTRFALEHRRQLTCIVVRKLRRRMHGLMHSAVLYRLLTIGMEYRGCKAVLMHDDHTEIKEMGGKPPR